MEARAGLGGGRIPTRIEAAADDRRRWVAFHGSRAALLLLMAVLTYMLFPTAAAVDTPVFEIGAVATEDVIAPFSFDVPKAQAVLQAEREDVARTARPIFVFSSEAVDSAQTALVRFMQAVAAAAGPTGGPTRADEVQRAAAAVGVSLTPDEAEYLAFPGRRQTMESGIRRLYARWLPTGVAVGSALDDVRGEVILRRGTEERGLPADSIMTFSTLLARARQMHPDPDASVADGLYIKLVQTFFVPTVLYDRASTEQRRAELRTSVSPVQYSVRAGERIVGQHEVVGRAEFDKMRALQEALQQRNAGERPIRRIIGAIIYNALVLSIFGIALVLFRPQLYESFRSLGLFAVTFLLVLIGGALAASVRPVHPELVPVALAAIILSILFDPRISMIAAMILAVLVGGQGAFRGTNALFLNLIAGAAGALSVRVVRRRTQAYYSITVIALAYLLAAIAIGLTLGWSAREIGVSGGWGVVNAIASVMLAMFLLPLAERLTGLTTDLTLLEYSDLNRPLLRRLMVEAPGTYLHTIAMANLVEAACNAIGANGLLGRVGTYYHDIGKLKKPQYFVENQGGHRNPHDKLKPGTSAAIIRNHIREGLELADENQLPPVIKAFIAQHHGTGAIAYFLEKAKERDGVPPSTQEFSYPGPLPHTAETAICMLADGVEAASRVLQDPSADKLRDMIDHIVRQRIEEGQLTEAPLTLKQLDTVKEAFARVLEAQYHRRIDYPLSSGGITSEFASTS